jgi:hypothetical protein
MLIPRYGGRSDPGIEHRRSSRVGTSTACSGELNPRPVGDGGPVEAPAAAVATGTITTGLTQASTDTDYEPPE